MAVTEEFKKLARDSVDILSILKYIEDDLNVDFNIQEGSTINLRCPCEVINNDTNVHKTNSTSKTSISLNRNLIKCWNPACNINKGLDTIELIRLFYENYSFEKAVKTVLEIGGFEYTTEKKELTEETKIKLVLTRYINECCNDLIKGYEIIEQNIEPKGRTETLCVDAAKYLLNRGIPKLIAKKLKFGVGGCYSKVLKTESQQTLIKAKILSSKNKFEIMARRIIIPNISNGLAIGMTGRDIYDTYTRYLNVGSVKNLINIDRAKKYSKIFLFEGALNGASYMTLTGKENFMAMQGAETFKKEFLLHIIKNNIEFNKDTEFIYVSDCDTAGLQAAKNLGLEILRLGFQLNVLITPKDNAGKKIDTNDVLKKYGINEGKKKWDEFLKTSEPFIIFAIKQEFLLIQEPNAITREMAKCKIIQKYLRLDFVDPNERWILEQYFSKHGYPSIKEFFKYADLKFSKTPQISNNSLICFVGGIDKNLENILIENNKSYNILDIEYKVNIYNVSNSITFILITNPLFIIKTRRIAQHLLEKKYNVKVFYTDKPITSLMEYIYAINSAIEAKSFFAFQC